MRAAPRDRPCCPTPDLTPYPTFAKAMHVCRYRRRAHDEWIKPYKCKCGQFHLQDPRKIPDWARFPERSKPGYRNRNRPRLRRVA